MPKFRNSRNTGGKRQVTSFSHSGDVDHEENMKTDS